VRNLLGSFFIIFFTLILMYSCNKSTENKKNGVDNNSHTNNSLETVTDELSENDDEGYKQSNDFVPSITEISRFAYVYPPSTDDDNKLKDLIPVYNKIDDENEPKLKIEKNTEVWVNLTVNKSWYQLVCEDGRWGYVKKEHIKLYPRAIVNTKSGKLNLRKNKTIDSKVIKGLPKDSLIYVLNIDDKDWYLIRDDKGNVGYVAGKYLKFVDGKNNLFVGISQDKFFEDFFQIKEAEYLFMMEGYKDVALNKHSITGDFNGGGRLDKSFFAVKSGDDDDDKVYMVTWHSETNTYFVVEEFVSTSYIGLELFPKEDTLQSAFEEESITMSGDGIGLVHFDDGEVIVYYWDNREYRSFVYNSGQ
jgi:hypothetical protein